MRMTALTLVETKVPRYLASNRFFFFVVYFVKLSSRQPVAGLSQDGFLVSSRASRRDLVWRLRARISRGSEAATCSSSASPAWAMLRSRTLFLVDLMLRDPTPQPPDVHAWLRSPLGQRVSALERKLASEALAQVFGWQMLQIGLWGDDARADGRGTRSAEDRPAWHGDRPGTTRGRSVRARIRSRSPPTRWTRCVLPHTLEYEPEPHDPARGRAHPLRQKATWWCSVFGRCRAGGSGPVRQRWLSAWTRAPHQRGASARLAEAPWIRDRRCTSVPVHVALGIRDARHAASNAAERTCGRCSQADT